LAANFEYLNQIFGIDPEFNLVFGDSYLDNLKKFDLIIKTPGISLYHSKVYPYKHKITSQAQIFFDYYQGKIIAVSGTKGKSTTCTLICEMLKNAKKDVQLIGNIGNPVLDFLDIKNPASQKNEYVAFEVSSYMLEGLKKNNYISVLLNIYSDHIDRHNGFENYKNAAIDNPYDKQAMRTYLYLEKFMQDKAIAFGYERQKIVYSDPFLDSTSKRPTANMGLRTMNREASEYRDSLIAEVGSKSGIFFFYRSDCSFCEQQAPLVKALEKEYGFSIRPVSLDGLALKEPLWDDFIVNDNQAETLGVYQVPATYIFNPETNTIELIAQGLQSLPQLKDRIIAASERAGLISTDQANLTHGSGLYQSLDGQYSAGVPFPDDAPEEFKTLYSQFVSQEKSQ